MNAKNYETSSIMCNNFSQNNVPFVHGGQKREKDQRIIHNEIDIDPGITKTELQKNTNFGRKKVDNAVKALLLQGKVTQKDDSFYCTHAETRTFIPTGIHNLTLVFRNDLDLTVVSDLIARIKSKKPINGFPERDFKCKYNAHNTFDISCTDSPLTREEFNLFWNEIISFFKEADIRMPHYYFACVEFNIDFKGFRIEGMQCLTKYQFDRNFLTRAYNHGDHSRFEIKVPENMSFKEINGILGGWLTLEAYREKLASSQQMNEEFIKKANRDSIEKAVLREEKDKLQERLDTVISVCEMKGY
jgi:hypothetical protein